MKKNINFLYSFKNINLKIKKIKNIISDSDKVVRVIINIKNNIKLMITWAILK